MPIMKKLIYVFGLKITYLTRLMAILSNVNRYFKLFNFSWAKVNIIKVKN